MARPRACPDSRLLAIRVSYQHIFGTTTAIEPEKRAAELQFDIRALSCLKDDSQQTGAELVVSERRAGEGKGRETEIKSHACIMSVLNARFPSLDSIPAPTPAPTRQFARRNRVVYMTTSIEG